MSTDTVRERLMKRTIPVKATRPREVTVNTGELLIKLDRIRMKHDDPNFDRVIKAVARALKWIEVRKQIKKKKGKKFAYSHEDVAADAINVAAVVLVLHERNGAMQGEDLEDPFMGLYMDDGARYFIDFKGKPTQTCQFCGGHATPMQFGRKTKKYYHVLCHREAVRAKIAEVSKPQNIVVEV